MLHRLHRAAEIGGDHRPPHRLRLDHHAAERLGLRRGVHHDIGQHQRRRHVVALADETQPVGDAQRLGLTDQARRYSAGAPGPSRPARSTRRAGPSGRAPRSAPPAPSNWSAGQAAARPSAPSGSRHACARRAIRSPETASGSNTRGSTPRGMTRMRAGSVPWRATISSAMKRLAAITRSPFAITEL